MRDIPILVAKLLTGILVLTVVLAYGYMAVSTLVASPPPQLGTLHSRNVKNSLVFYETHLKRLVFAIGPDSVTYSSDFVRLPIDDTTGDPTEWTTTVVEAGAGDTLIALQDGAGGLVRITTAANDNDGGSYQLGATAFELTSDQELYCGFFGVAINDVTQSDFFIGLAVTDTAILAAVTDRIGFQSVDASASLTFPVEKNSTETNFDPTVTLVDATAVDLEFYFDGTGLEIFVDGVSQGRPAVTNLPDDVEMRLSWEFLTGEAVAQTMDINRITCIQLGR